MMAKRRGIVFIALGVILAVVVGVLVFIITQTASNSRIATAQVVVAAQDILDRTVIEPGAVAIKQMPVDSIPIGAFTKTEDVVGRMVPNKIYAGEVILKPKLVDSKGQSGMSFTMEKGKVLITFPASNIVGLGLVRPGDVVDVLITLHAKKNNNQQTAAQDTMTAAVTQATMQNLKVVTVGSQASNSGASQQQQVQQQSQPQGQASLITFAVEPQDALVLKSIKDSEDLVIELALRAAGDEGIYKTEPVTIKRTMEKYGITPILLQQ